MGNFNFGGRIGMSTLIVAVKALCNIYLRYQAPILEYIDGSSLTSDQKSQITSWLNLASASCAILVTLEFKYE